MFDIMYCNELSELAYYLNIALPSCRKITANYLIITTIEKGFLAMYLCTIKNHLR